MDALFEVFRGEGNGDYVYVQENDRDRWVLDGITNLPLAVNKALTAADAVLCTWIEATAEEKKKQNPEISDYMAGYAAGMRAVAKHLKGAGDE